jgi:protein involved in polysaccharide export with SLBB domain
MGVATMRQVDSILKHTGLVLLLTAAALGCAARERPVTVISLSPPSSSGEYVVQAGDTLDIKFYYHPDHDQRGLIVRPDGKLLLPLIGDIQAVGMTPEQLAEDIAQRYSFTLRDPKVAVDVKTTNTGQVYVGGEVLRPGMIKLKPKMNLVQAVFEAGGPKDEGDIDRVVLLRSMGDNQFGYREINLRRIVKHEEPADDALLAQDDLIFIPKNGIAKANLWVQKYIRNMLPFGNPIRAFPIP